MVYRGILAGPAMYLHVFIHVFTCACSACNFDEHIIGDHGLSDCRLLSDLGQLEPPTLTDKAFQPDLLTEAVQEALRYLNPQLKHSIINRDMR